MKEPQPQNPRSPERLITSLLQPQPEIVVVSGGPCAGKSTLLDRLPAEAQRQGRKLEVIPEIATRMMQQGVDFVQLAMQDRPAYLDKQREIIQLELDAIAELKRQHRGTDALIVMDRGINDVFAYMTPAESRQIAELFGSSPLELGYNITDKVVYLSSLATHTPEAYDRLRGSNATRYESADDAAATCNRTFNEWAQHPELHLADGANFAETLRRATEFCLGGENEYEQKWQVAAEAAEKIIASKAESGEMVNLTQITQAYGEIDGLPFRLRQAMTRGCYEYFHLAVKEKTAVGNREIRRTLTATQHAELQPWTNARLQKIRYTFRHKRQLWQADCTRHRGGEVWHFEAEVANPADFATLELPFADYAGKLTDVSARDIAYNE